MSSGKATSKNYLLMKQNGPLGITRMIIGYHDICIHTTHPNAIRGAAREPLVSFKGTWSLTNTPSDDP